MKMFHYQAAPGEYAEEAHVMAETKEQADLALKSSKPERLEGQTDDDYEWLCVYHSGMIARMLDPNLYAVVEHLAGDVVFTEKS